MACKRCGGVRILEVQGKCSDLFGMWKDGKEFLGYVPNEIEIGGGDCIEFAYCLNCGQIVGDFPVREDELQRYFYGEEEDE